MSEVVIRPLRIPAELDEVCALYGELVTQHGLGDADDEVSGAGNNDDATTPPLRDQVAEVANEPSAALLVAIADGRMVGFVSGHVSDPPSGGLERYDGPILYVADLLVTADYRRRNVGSRLMDELEHWGRGRGATSVVLHVAAENTAAAKFYDQREFRPVYVKRRKDFPSIKLRAATAADSEFCYEVNKLAMREYVAAIWGWDESVQRAYHENRWSPERTRVITVNGIDAGTLDVEYRQDEIYLARIVLHPYHQGRGIGGSVLRGVLDEARHRNQSVSLDVLAVNERAYALYRRLGFLEEYRHGDNDRKVRMRWWL